MSALPIEIFLQERSRIDYFISVIWRIKNTYHVHFLVNVQPGNIMVNVEADHLSAASPLDKCFNTFCALKN